MSYIVYTHRRYDINTLRDFVTIPGSILKGYTYSEEVTIDEIIRRVLDYDGGTGKKNIERLWAGYNQVEQGEFTEDSYNLEKSNISTVGYVTQLSLLKRNTVLLLEIERLNTNLLAVEGSLVVDTRNFNVFVGEALEKLNKDIDYIPSHFTGNELLGVTKQVSPSMSVWIWCRSLSDPSQTEMQGSIINLTPFITNIDTYSMEGGGSFNFNLPPIIASWENGKWDLKPESVKIYSSKNLNYVAEATMNYLKQGKLTRSSFYFHNIIAENDIVFIRFERLKTEQKRKLENPLTIEVDKSNLPGNIYDMIGLVDNAMLSTNGENNQVNITVSGRDLMKLFVEDGCYFYPLAFTDGGLFSNSIDLNGITRIDGKIAGLISGIQKSIGFALQFIFNALSSIQVCPDSLFDSYGDARTTKFPLQFKEDEEATKDDPTKGIWQIVKLLVDESIRDRYVVDSSIGNENGSIMNHISKVCQTPFVEFFGDTYGDQFYFIARKQPFTRDLMKGLINLINEDTGTFIINEEDVMTDRLDFENNAGYTWYRIIPNGLLAGAGSEVVWAYIPAVYFSEFADIWGQRPFEVVTNYVFYDSQKGNKQTYNTSFLVRQGLFDLKYVVDSNSYLPFTRKGTIVLTGDRRFKRGTIVYRPATDEYCYVEGVNNTYMDSDEGVIRTTTLTVERCMVKGVNDSTWEKYFQIVNTKLTEEDFKNEKVVQGEFENTSDLESTMNSYKSWIEGIFQNWQVDKDTLNFFLQRKQLS